MRTAIVLVALALGVGAAGGCGDDDDENGGDRLSRSEYIARSNESCRRHEADAGRQFQEIVGEGRPTPAEAQRFLREAVIPNIREGLEERRALGAPEGDEDEVAAIIRAGEETVAGFERLAADREQVAALFEGRAEDPATEFDRLSREYGIEECGGGN